MDRFSSPVSVAATGLILPATLVVGLLATSEPAEACLHGENDTSVEVAQSGQTALIYYDDGRQHLFVTAGAESNGDASRLGWVIPVPETPDDYGTAPSRLFEDLGAWMNLRRVDFDPPQTLGGGGSSVSSRKLDVLATLRVGPYDVTPLEAEGEAGLKALKKWLNEHEFQVPESTEPARHYVEHGWTFLAVEVSPDAKSDTLELDGHLRPLRLSFDSDRAVYPLIFESRQGRFPVTIHLVTNRPVPGSALDGVRAKGFFAAGSYEGETPDFESEDGGGPFEDFEDERDDGPDPPPNSIRPPTAKPNVHYVVEHRRLRRDSVPDAVATSLSEVGAWEGRRAVSIRTLHTPTFNSGRASPKTWDEDWTVPAASSGQTMANALRSDGSGEADAGTEGPPDAGSRTEATGSNDGGEAPDARASLRSGTRLGAGTDETSNRGFAGAWLLVLLVAAGNLGAGTWFVVADR